MPNSKLILASLSLLGLIATVTLAAAPENEPDTQLVIAFKLSQQASPDATEKTLAEPTIDDNARFFDKREDVPIYAITMGVGTILEARNVVFEEVAPLR